MEKQVKFSPKINRVALNPEQAVLTCHGYRDHEQIAMIYYDTPILEYIPTCTIEKDSPENQQCPSS
jgi:hypothetical protein